MKPSYVRTFFQLFVAGAVVATALPTVAAVPTGRYTSPSAGTVFDTKTKLAWQQTAPSGTYSWTDAKAYCATLTPIGWRLPTMKELQTLVDDSRTGPAIDPIAFPGTPSAVFWSSSSVAGQPGLAWVVIFFYGNTNTYATTRMFNLRCVR
jgi:Protein of unknown function (DUF1566)